MSELRLAKTTDIQNFPGCLSVVDNTPPIAQCQEAQIDESAGAVADGPATITDVGAFAAIDLTGKKVTVTAPVGDAGTYNCLSNTDDVLLTDHAFGEVSAVAAYTVHDDGEVYLTRNEKSFARFAQSLSAPFTFLNGQLYTTIATGPLAAACSDTYAPL